MNVPRKNKVITDAASNQLDGPMGFLRRHINNILTVLLVIAAIVMFVRWRMKTADMNKQAVGMELTNARTQVQRLKNGQISGSSPADMIKGVTALETAADSGISSVLNNSDATNMMRGQALVLRGNLYWQLANLPMMPGSATEPTLRLNETPEIFLQKSFDAFSEVVKNSTYADEHESLATAHLGLGVIAENRGDWKTATDEFQAVVNDKDAMAVLVDQARIQLAEIPEAKKAWYVAPPTGMAAAILGPTLPTTLPTTLPGATQISASTQPVLH